MAWSIGQSIGQKVAIDWSVKRGNRLEKSPIAWWLFWPNESKSSYVINRKYRIYNTCRNCGYHRFDLLWYFRFKGWITWSWMENDDTLDLTITKSWREISHEFITWWIILLSVDALTKNDTSLMCLLYFLEGMKCGVCDLTESLREKLCRVLPCNFSVPFPFPLSLYL